MDVIDGCSVVLDGHRSELRVVRRHRDLAVPSLPREATGAGTETIP